MCNDPRLFIPYLVAVKITGQYSFSVQEESVIILNCFPYLFNIRSVDICRVIGLYC